ncbi:MAG: MBOAT family O-acyltransferase [Planctomycetota bacterium]
MLFTEFRFLVLFVVCFCVYWSLPKNQPRKYWLLLCSCVFYGVWSLNFLGLMFCSITFDYVMGRLLEHEKDARRRKLWLVFSIIANLGLLGVFKYADWFIASANEFAKSLGVPIDWQLLKLVLPPGISFYTFQSMSYTIDVYRGHLKAERSYLNFALYVAFFPQLVAGPIVRAIDFLHQLEEKRWWQSVAVRSCLTLILVGYFKKAVVADNVSVISDQVFENPAAFDTLSIWIGLCMYHVRIYCDFSGYSDIAIGTAGLLGYQLTNNFAFPFFSPSIGEFWRRWHQSLGTWLKDYLYVPLGGSFGSWGQTIRNIWITMVLCGLWHGAGWQYISFGILHAFYVTSNRIWKHNVTPESALGRVMKYASVPVTTYFLFIGWPIFGSHGVEQTKEMYEIFFFLAPGGTESVSSWWLAVFALLALVHYMAFRKVVSPWVARLPNWVYALGYGVAFAFVLLWVARGYKAFIYFVF